MLMNVDAYTYFCPFDSQRNDPLIECKWFTAAAYFCLPTQGYGKRGCDIWLGRGLPNTLEQRTDSMHVAQLDDFAGDLTSHGVVPAVITCPSCRVTSR